MPAYLSMAISHSKSEFLCVDCAKLWSSLLNYFRHHSQLELLCYKATVIKIGAKYGFVTWYLSKTLQSFFLFVNSCRWSRRHNIAEKKFAVLYLQEWNSRRHYQEVIVMSFRNRILLKIGSFLLIWFVIMFPFCCEIIKVANISDLINSILAAKCQCIF